MRVSIPQYLYTWTNDIVCKSETSRTLLTFRISNEFWYLS